MRNNEVLVESYSSASTSVKPSVNISVRKLGHLFAVNKTFYYSKILDRAQRERKRESCRQREITDQLESKTIFFCLLKLYIVS